ncbi:LexA family protein [Clostridium grantii]|uniref:SOS regulatory protein LexA n=1 Tax=Clostridium grantii DSM 8605 TaxID=1121316 RepID=A0A1M5UHD2_9CLOT|nr:S24 family peptidase [Clostridium grantii]SHH62424.1 SOS regulatory protein LexA [Clostridium grantii DSM 8605]
MDKYYETSKSQKSFILSKPSGKTTEILKGKKFSGKSTSLSYRILFLKNNYILNPKDKILVILFNQMDKENFVRSYKKISRSNDELFNTLLSGFLSNEENIEFVTFEKVISELFFDYLVENNKLELLIERKEIEKIMVNAIEEVKKDFKRNKILKKENWEFFSNEIRWIKSSSWVNVKEYLDSPRKGWKHKGNSKPTLKKNSSSREAVIALYNYYNRELEKQGYIDYEDMLKYINNTLSSKNSNKKSEFLSKYVHIIVDDTEKFSSSEIELIENLYYDEDHSTMTFSININNKEKENQFSKIVRNKRIYTEELPGVSKKYTLKHSFTPNESLERFKYFDLKHLKEFNILKDSSNFEELIVEDEEEIEYGKEELNQIPVFNNIAAGDPIYMEPEQQDSFSLPKYWTKGMQDCFILKVKGDSMINANIQDRDMVVIQTISSATHNDIVAVNIEGNATLKRLYNKNGKVMLMPENQNYKPIIVKEEGFYLIGKAVGVIRAKQ